MFYVCYESVCFPLLYIPAFLLYSVLYSLWLQYLCYVICFCAVLCVCLISRNLSRGSFGNSLSTSSEVEVWTAYILPPPDPTKWEYTGFVVVVVVVVPIVCNFSLFLIFDDFSPSGAGSYA